MSGINVNKFRLENVIIKGDYVKSEAIWRVLRRRLMNVFRLMVFEQRVAITEYRSLACILIRGVFSHCMSYVVLLCHVCEF